jgi:uncharacterized protein
MEHNRKPFLTAEWLHLAVLNFEVDPAVLRPYLPPGTELDDWNGTTLISLVGFCFRDLRLRGLAIPFHRAFDEVNLRFYVRRNTRDGWRRAVVFVREFAPRRAVAWAARWFYGENYTTVPMHRHIEIPNGDPSVPYSVSYWWRYGGREHHIEVTAQEPARLPTEGTQEHFVVEQQFGYSGRPGRSTIEYRVEHRPWRIWQAREARFVGDVVSLYGEQFVEPLSARPCSAFLVDGSHVELFPGIRLRPAAAALP